MKAWLATGALALGVVQALTALRMFGRIRRGPTVRAVTITHRVSGVSTGTVVLMGDLNALPADGAMSVLHTNQHGDGEDGESHESGQGSHACRCGEPTDSSSKFDYIFGSSRDIDAVDEGLSASQFSDHKALLGRVAKR